MFATLMTRQQHQFLSGIAWGGSKLPTSESGFLQDVLILLLVVRACCSPP
jgi:hypothetical protein